MISSFPDLDFSIKITIVCSKGSLMRCKKIYKWCSLMRSFSLFKVNKKTNPTNHQVSFLVVAVMSRDSNMSQNNFTYPMPVPSFLAMPPDRNSTSYEAANAVRQVLQAYTESYGNQHDQQAHIRRSTLIPSDSDKLRSKPPLFPKTIQSQNYAIGSLYPRPTVVPMQNQIVSNGVQYAECSPVSNGYGYLLRMPYPNNYQALMPHLQTTMGRTNNGTCNALFFRIEETIIIEQMQHNFN